MVLKGARVRAGAPAVHALARGWGLLLRQNARATGLGVLAQPLARPLHHVLARLARAPEARYQNIEADIGAKTVGY